LQPVFLPFHRERLPHFYPFHLTPCSLTFPGHRRRRVSPPLLHSLPPPPPLTFFFFPLLFSFFLPFFPFRGFFSSTGRSFVPSTVVFSHSAPKSNRPVPFLRLVSRPSLAHFVLLFDFHADLPSLLCFFVCALEFFFFHVSPNPLSPPQTPLPHRPLYKVSV